MSLKHILSWDLRWINKIFQPSQKNLFEIHHAGHFYDTVYMYSFY